MKPVYQSKFKNGDGDCLSAAIASILEWDLSEIPNFSLYDGQFYPKLWNWLQSRNIGILATDNRPSGFHLIKVKSPRILGSFHELVGMKGERLFDPHPEGNCIGEFVHNEILYALDPSKPFKRTCEKYK